MYFSVIITFVALGQIEKSPRPLTQEQTLYVIIYLKYHIIVVTIFLHRFTADQYKFNISHYVLIILSFGEIYNQKIGRKPAVSF